ncbi:MAG: FHA domain-containing protein [Sporomusa sp.]
MLGNMQVLNVVVIALQYSLVLLLYLFLYRVVKVVYQDLSQLSGQPQQLSARQLQVHKGSQPAQLVMISDEKSLLSQTVFPLSESLVIGRSQHNDLVINDAFISHEHACISKSKQDYFIADLNSTNGTLLNGKQIDEETALADGDVIQIGAVTLKFER